MEKTMAQFKDTAYFKKLLVQFIGEADPLFEMLKWFMHRLMDIEASAKVGVEKGKHARDRKTYFSGTRVRRFDTRLGTVYLLVPKLRNGGYIPFFVTERTRAEQALIQVVQEAYINGISTRKIERLARSLGIENISAGQVSEINRDLNKQVEEFRTRPLQSEYPVIWIDALYEKIRDNDRVVNMAILVVHGINLEGKREILGVEPMYDESAASWGSLFNQLKERGLERAWLVVSDAHKGIQQAVREHFLNCSWQRCKVHFMRNILAHVRHQDKAQFGERLKQIWLQPDLKGAMRIARAMIEDYGEKYPEAVECLEEGLEDSLQFYGFEHLDRRKISSTNVLERLNKEIRRRSRVVGVFPSKDSYLRLLVCYLFEYSEDWVTEKGYIGKEVLLSQRAIIDSAA
jgi:putative transposase